MSRRHPIHNRSQIDPFVNPTDQEEEPVRLGTKKSTSEQCPRLEVNPQPSRQSVSDGAIRIIPTDCDSSEISEQQESVASQETSPKPTEVKKQRPTHMDGLPKARVIQVRPAPK